MRLRDILEYEYEYELMSWLRLAPLEPLEPSAFIYYDVMCCDATSSSSSYIFGFASHRR
jgi:hypothetical protein